MYMRTQLIIDLLNIARILLLLCALCILLYSGYVIHSFRNPVPFVPTRRRVARRMIALAQIQPGEIVYDLGSGTGTLLLYAAKGSAAREIIGIEQSAILRFCSRLRLALHPQTWGRVRIIADDFYKVSVHRAHVILTFLTPIALERLAPRLLTLAPGTRIVSYMFSPRVDVRLSCEAHEEQGERIFVCTKM